MHKPKVREKEKSHFSLYGAIVWLFLAKDEAVINKEITLSAKVENAAADAKVVWASSDEKVATVADGKVTPVADGEAVISATG